LGDNTVVVGQGENFGSLSNGIFDAEISASGDTSLTANNFGDVWMVAVVPTEVLLDENGGSLGFVDGGDCFW